MLGTRSLVEKFLCRLFGHEGNESWCWVSNPRLSINSFLNRTVCVHHKRTIVDFLLIYCFGVTNSRSYRHSNILYVL